MTASSGGFAVPIMPAPTAVNGLDHEPTNLSNGVFWQANLQQLEDNTIDVMDTDHVDTVQLHQHDSVMRKPSKEMLELTPDYYNYGKADMSIPENSEAQARHIPMSWGKRRWNVLVMAYQAMGVVFAGLGTSPLYTIPSFQLEHPTEENYLGMLSILFWTLTFISFVKYSLIILQADDHGEGGTFALYSLLCQHANIARYGRVPKRREGFVPKPNTLQSWLIGFLERSALVQKSLFVLMMMGVCMLIGDGIVTPAISVLSAVDGLRTTFSSLNQSAIVMMTVLALLLLFMVQRFGTRRVSFMFSPIMLLWFVTTGIIGVYDVAVYNPGVLKAVSPHYIFSFFRQNKRPWKVLAGTVLCISGSEAIYADLGHFDKLSMRLGLIFVVYPSNVVAYAGQVAYLTKAQDPDTTSIFYKATPQAVFWPMLVIATLSAIVAAQCLISACFSIVKQSVALDLFPKVTLIHTSTSHEGQIYSPQVNYFLMILCPLVVLGFRDVNALGNAYGVAVIMVMLITTITFSLLMVVMWNVALPLVFLFLVVFGTIESVYVFTVLGKVPQGGWFPFAVSACIGVIMYTWVYGRTTHRAYEKANMLSGEELDAWLGLPSIKRVDGLCIFYSDFEDDIPPLMKHYLQTIRAPHQIVVLTTVCYTKVPIVPDDERFKFSLCSGHPKAGVYRCVALYGYTEERTVFWTCFCETLVQRLKLYIEELDESELKHEIAGMEETSQGMGTELGQLVVNAAREERPVLVIGKVRLVTSRSGLKYWFKKVFLDILYRVLYSTSTSAAQSLTGTVASSDFVEISMLYEV